MTNIFSTRLSDTTTSAWLFICRVTIGAFMLTHGIPKLQHVIEGNFQFGNPIGIGSTASLILVVFAEVLCSILLILGLATRFASIVLIINMLVATFIALGSEPFAKKELALLYLLIYIGLFLLGGGRYSLDALIKRKRTVRY